MRLALTLAHGEGGRLARAVVARVAGSRFPVGTVVLALQNTAPIDEEGRETLGAVAGGLAELGVKLRLAIAAPGVRKLWQEQSKGHLAGVLPVHPSLRCAVLASYAALPGPGLVTGSVRSDLAQPAEHVDSAAGQPDSTQLAGQPLHPLRRGPGGCGRWWTGLVSPAAQTRKE